jgi:hypothetical protein
LELIELKKRGYRIISRAHRLAARVDREDWKEFLATKGACVEADFYRRVYSKDVITVSSYAARKLPSSCHDQTGFTG